MAEETGAPAENDAGGADAEQTQQGLTPALVRAITEKVYALWLNDLRIERERLGAHSNQHAGWDGRRK